MEQSTKELELAELESGVASVPSPVEGKMNVLGFKKYKTCENDFFVTVLLHD
tara:strand:- start:797 stop:952 length:156 start_codon:yes stop_codon:yes gene_type:complete